jgi:sugar fermentation stimulation protein A
VRFPTPLIRGRLIRRYKRFLSDIVLDSGEEVVAHCANPGAMTGLLAPNAEVWLSRASNPSRKLKYSWELVRVGDGLVGINTNLPNAIVAEAIAAGRVPELAGYGSMRRRCTFFTSTWHVGRAGSSSNKSMRELTPYLTSRRIDP